MGVTSVTGIVDHLGVHYFILFFVWSLRYLSVLDLWFLITLLVSSNPFLP
jgi:hypothetical protein